MMLSAFVAPHSLLDRLVCSKIDGMRRACTTIYFPLRVPDNHHIPAPTITLDIPRHSEAVPSIFVIVETAFVRLV